MRKILIPLDLLPIKDEGYHIFVYIHINGIEARMLLDTGASRTVFDTESLKAMQADIEMEENEDKAVGLGNNAVDNFITRLKVLEIGELKIKDFQAGVLDLSHVNISYAGIDFPTITGVLGSDILVKYKAIIDLGKSELMLFTN